MRSIIRQLSLSGNAQRQVHDLLLTEYERREAESKVDGFEVPRMRLSKCVKLISDITRSNPATIIIDAVDEVQENRQFELLDALKQITEESASVVKVFITSRENSNVFAQLSAVPKNTRQYRGYPESYARNVALQAFSWLLCIHQALSPSCFVAAITMANPAGQLELTLAELVDVCCNLIVLDSKLNVVRFAHVSMQEFLETKSELRLNHVHRVAAMSCLNICLRGIPVKMEDSVCQIDDFYHYGALFWAEHCRAVRITDRNNEVLLKLQEFIFADGDVSTSLLAGSMTYDSIQKL